MYKLPLHAFISSDKSLSDKRQHHPSAPLSISRPAHGNEEPQLATPPDTSRDISYKLFSAIEHERTHHRKRNSIPTPPSSPLQESPCLTSSLESAERILKAKNAGNLRLISSEMAALKRKGVCISPQIYHLVLDAYISHRREGTPLTLILKVYDEMLYQGIEPSSKTNRLMIRILCRRDVEVQKTVAMLRRQSARSGQHAGDLCILETEGNLDRALAIFRQSVAVGAVESIDIDTYNQILRVLSHYGDPSEALFIFDQLEQSPHVNPNAATFAALINLYGRAGMIDIALSFFAKYSAVQASLEPHDVSYVYNALVDCHLKCERVDDAIQIIENDMPTAGIHRSIIPYNALLRYYCTQDALSDAHALLSRLEQEEGDDFLDASSYGPLLATYCQQDNLAAATDMYKALITKDISKAYGNLANFAMLCLAHQDRHQALSVAKDMCDASLEPEPILIQRIVEQFIKANEIDEAVKVMKKFVPCMSPRTLSKGSHALVDAALSITGAAGSRLNLAIEAARLVMPRGPSSVPLAIALLEAFLALPSPPTALGREDYEWLIDAVILARHTTLATCSSTTGLVLLLHNAMRTAGIVPNTRLFTRILSHLTSMGETQLAEQWKAAWATNGDSATFEHETSEGSVRSKQVMDAVLRGQPSVARDHLFAMVEEQIVPTPSILGDAIALAGKQGHLDTAREIYTLALTAFKKLDGDAAKEDAVYMINNGMLIGYAQQGDMVHAKQFYDAIKATGHVPDGNGYASLLLGTAKATTDEAMDALIIYDDAKKHNVKPTTFFYNVVISKLAKARKLDAALRLFHEMKQFKITPNSITYGAIISACVRAGSETNVRRFFTEMLASSNYQPRVGPFNNLMQFYVRQKPNRQRVLEYFHELRRRRIKPSLHTYKLLIEAYASMTPYDMPTAHSMLTEMERRDKIRPQATHYATLIYAYGTLQRDVKSAERVFDEMIRLDVTPDEAVYQSMIDTWISNDCLERAEELYKTMTEKMTRSQSPYIENLFIRGYGEHGQLDKAAAMFECMTDDKCYQEQEDKGTKSARSPIVREPSTYEAMVQAYLSHGLIDKAKEVLDQMIQCQFPEKVVAHVSSLVYE